MMDVLIGTSTVFMVSSVAVFLLLVIIELIETGKFMWWFMRYGLWRKKQYSIVLDSDGDIGIEITPNVALALPFVISHHNIIICKVPKETDDNSSLNSYWSQRGFVPQFDNSPLRRNRTFAILFPAQWMLKRLETLYLDELNSMEDMRKI